MNIMAFERRDGPIGGAVTKYGDVHLVKCPFCGAVHPLWLTDAQPLDDGLNSYQFQCPRCGGVVEYVADDEKAFQEDGPFQSIKLLQSGRGSYNLNFVGLSITQEQLETIIKNVGVIPASPAVVNNPQWNAAAYQEMVRNDSKRTPALLGMIFGIIGLSTSFIYGLGFLSAAVGFILSIVGFKSSTNHGKAVAGLVTSIIGLVISSIYLIILMLVFIIFGYSIY